MNLNELRDKLSEAVYQEQAKASTTFNAACAHSFFIQGFDTLLNHLECAAGAVYNHSEGLFAYNGEAWVTLKSYGDLNQKLSTANAQVNKLEDHIKDLHELYAIPNRNKE